MDSLSGNCFQSGGRLNKICRVQHCRETEDELVWEDKKPIQSFITVS